MENGDCSVNQPPSIVPARRHILSNSGTYELGRIEILVSGLALTGFEGDYGDSDSRQHSLARPNSLPIANPERRIKG